MAITILQSPDSIMPVYNDIVFTVNSTNKAQCSFRYVCDVYVNGNYITRLKLFPYGANGYASFKVNRVLEDFVSYDLHANLYGTNIFSRNNETIKDYQLKFGEEYDSSAQCDAGTTVYPNLTNTSTFSFFNGAFQYKNWLTYASSQYKMTAATSKFLSNIPNGAYINFGDQMTLNFMQTGVVDRLRIITYDSIGTSFGTYTYVNNFFSVSSYTDRILTVGVGPENLNNSTLTSGTQPVIHSNVYTYTAQLIDLSGNPVSELKTFTMDRRYQAFTPHRIWWLNRLGGFDSYDYSQKDYRKVDTSRTEFTKLLGEYRATPAWTYDIGDRGRTVIGVDSQETDRYNSNWMTQNESLWMEELFTSPEVYMSEINGKLCFNQVTRSVIISEGGDPIDVIEIPYDTRFYSTPEVGDFIFVDFGDNVDLSPYAGPVEVIGVGSGGDVLTPTIIIAGPHGATGPVHVVGFALPMGFISTLDPVVIKTTSYEEKIKYRFKNIQYEIEVDKAYGINTQRN